MLSRHFGFMCTIWIPSCCAGEHPACTPFASILQIRDAECCVVLCVRARVRACACACVDSVTYGSDPDPIFNTYHTFARALLADGASLTPRPGDADLLLAPAFGTNMEKLVEYYEHAQEYLAKHYPAIWQRHDGADHFWLISGDGGGCDFRFLPALRHSIRVAHYLKLNHSHGRRDTCGHAERDLAMPPEVPPVERRAYLSRAEKPMSQRPLTFFFAGNVPDAGQVDTTSDDALSREGYSEGMRQLVWKCACHSSPTHTAAANAPPPRYRRVPLRVPLRAPLLSRAPPHKVAAFHVRQVPEAPRADVPRRAALRDVPHRLVRCAILPRASRRGLGRAALVVCRRRLRARPRRV